MSSAGTGVIYKDIPVISTYDIDIVKYKIY